ncbi:hypothetical protein CAPTEDRAFT_228288 [Capitella teleta]|uniref:C-type lectin domain-containing protein n=1 Tax=Capitella teleta TaxID=283909 RepID=R7USQ2_CAPTE|nr:hypothetical protein CAPTEDRAFT_228288 [Capitella teleta]|eukprot:ELU06436.1 hypothetical protein CAPTEDRAFT_228288 [Capitella teleta]
MRTLVLLLAPLCLLLPSPLTCTSGRITVRRGREVVLTRENLGVTLNPDTDLCRVQVVTADPASSRVGTVSPQDFDCSLTRNKVKYVNNGNPLLNEDVIRLHVYQFSGRSSHVQVILINVLVVDAEHSVFVDDSRLQEVRVEQQFGLSDAIDTRVLKFKYGYPSGATCVTSYSKYASGMPLAGDILDRHGVEIRTMETDCREVLSMGLRYKHRHQGSPNVDYLPLTVEVEDPSKSDRVISESLYLPIALQDSQPNKPPSIRVDAVDKLSVEQFSMLTLQPSVVSATDEETLDELLIFNISRQPSEGFFVHSMDLAQPLYSFVQADLVQHAIAYHTTNGSVGRGRDVEFELTAYDTHFASSPPVTLVIHIKPSKSLAPRIAVNRGLVVAEGRSQAITMDHLHVVDADNRERVEIHLKGGPRHGRLEVDGLPVIVFTPRDIRRGNVVYIHDGGDTTEDKLILRITDGDFTVRTKFSIRVLPSDDSSPYLTANKGFEVEQRGSVVMSTNKLSAHDKDSDDQHITFFIRVPPRFGEIVKRTHPLTAGRPVSEFTQKDVRRGVIYYHHLGSQDPSDSFEFRLMDKSEPPNKSAKYRVDISIQPSGNNLPPNRVDGTSSELTVRETDIAYITKDHLWYEDPEHLEHGSEVVYTITQAPFFLSTSVTVDAGRLVNVENVTLVVKTHSLPPVMSFTQEQVNQGKIAFMPPLEDIGPISRQARFTYAVSDREGSFVQDESFDLTIMPVNNQVPHMVVNDISVKEGEVVHLTTSHITAYDPDTEEYELIFTLEQEPRYGQLLKDDIKLVEGEQFTLLELTSANIRYEHDGSETTRDSFGLSVSDRMHKFSRLVPIAIKLHVNQGPRPREGLLRHLRVDEGGHSLITAANIGATDNDTDDALLRFLVIKSPTLGEIRLNGRIVTEFTQQDLFDERITFSHTSGEIGPDELADAVTFMVSDQTFPPAPGTKPLIDLGITIAPVDNAVPELVLGEPMFAMENEMTPLSHHMFTTRDIDTPSEQLRFVVTQYPQWGTLMHTSSHQPTASFTFSDLGAGLVGYSQDKSNGSSKPLLDAFGVVASDGNHQSEPRQVAITIIPQNDQVPDFMVEDLVVIENGEKKFEVKITDEKGLGDELEEMTLAVGRAPAHGQVVLLMDAIDGTGELMEIPLREVTLGDIAMGMDLVYKHDGSESLQDEFMLRLSNGYQVGREEVHVQILPLNDRRPEIKLNQRLQVAFGGDTVIDKEHIEVVDGDTPPGGLVYVIRKGGEKGVLQLQFAEEWKDLTSGANFTQADINAARLRYLHTKAIFQNPDEIEFEVSDGLNKAIRDKITMEIILLESGKVALLNRGMELNEGESVELTPDMLSARDGSNKPQDLVFVVTSPPDHGSLVMASNKQIDLSSFTQHDLQSRKVLYIHNGKPDTPRDSFHFSVMNGMNQSNSGIFHIKIEKVDKVMPSLDVNVPLTVVQGDRVPLTSANLHILDPDTPAENLTYVLMEGPQHGKLLRQDFVVSDTFTQADVDQGFMEYKSDSSDDSGVDFFLFAISDSHHAGYLINGTLEKRPAFFNILIQPISKEPPRIVVNRIPEQVESLGNGQNGFIISGLHLKAVHPLVQSRDIIYTVKDKPLYGYLEHLGTRRPVKRKFTQRDLNDGRIAYILEEPAVATSDNFTFRVHDLNRNTLDDQEFFLEWSVVSFDQSQYIVCEDAETLSVIVKREGALNSTSSVEIRSRGMSAKENIDYVPSNVAIIEFKPGDTTVSWDVHIHKDAVRENSEKLKILLRNPLNAVLTDVDKTVVQIINYDDGMCASYIGIITKRGRENRQDKDYLDYDHQDFGGDHFGVGRNYDSGIKQRSDRTVDRGPAYSQQNVGGVLETDLSFYTGGETARDESDPWSWEAETYADRDHDKKESRRRRRRKKKNRFATTTPPSTTVTKDANVRQPCTPDTEGLLYFDLLSSKMFRCSQRNWVEWGWGPNYLHSAMMQDSGGDGEDKEVDAGSKTCAHEWSLHRGTCHRLMPDRTTWTFAERSCAQEEGGHLTEVTSNRHMQFLWDLASEQPFWIGFNARRAVNTWEWTSGGPMRFSKWRKGFPRQGSTFSKRCTLVSRKGEWVNRPCDTVTSRYICSVPARSRRKRSWRT